MNVALITNLRVSCLCVWACLSAAITVAAQPITVNVDAAKSTGRFEPIWAWVGYDEPNYTYSDDGLHLLTQLSQLSAQPVHARTHNLLTSGDGTPSLKWGSTNAFARDASGNPVYDWAITDKIFDAYQTTGIKPLVEIGFTPQVLSTHPEPYRHHWPQSFDTGWTYPPTNYDEWSELVFRWVSHLKRSRIANGPWCADWHRTWARNSLPISCRFLPTRSIRM